MEKKEMGNATLRERNYGTLQEAQKGNTIGNAYIECNKESGKERKGKRRTTTERQICSQGEIFEGSPKGKAKSKWKQKRKGKDK